MHNKEVRILFNIDIRDAMRQYGVFGYQVAAEMGIAEATFSRKLARAEFNAIEKERIIKLIAAMAERRTCRGKK